MKYLLVMIICSQVQSTCYPPAVLKKEFNTSYDCLQEGYMESQKILKDLGENVVNEMNIIVKFTCKEELSSTI
jgi:hypothetical protein